jgi:hypothetical protein
MLYAVSYMISSNKFTQSLSQVNGIFKSLLHNPKVLMENTLTISRLIVILFMSKYRKLYKRNYHLENQLI